MRRLPRLRLPKIASDDAVFVAGWLLFSVGLGLWQLPAGFIGAGAVLLAVWTVGAIRR
jgi:hypothetical protein